MTFIFYKVNTSLSVIILIDVVLFNTGIIEINREMDIEIAARALMSLKRHVRVFSYIFAMLLK